MNRVGGLGLVFVATGVAAILRAHGMDAGVREGLVVFAPRDLYVALLVAFGLTTAVFGIICLVIGGVSGKGDGEVPPKSWLRLIALYIAVVGVLSLVAVAPEWIAWRLGKTWSWESAAQSFVFLALVAIPAFFEYRAPLRRWLAERRAATHLD